MDALSKQVNVLENWLLEVDGDRFWHEFRLLAMSVGFDFNLLGESTDRTTAIIHLIEFAYAREEIQTLWDAVGKRNPEIYDRMMRDVLPIGEYIRLVHPNRPVVLSFTHVNENEMAFELTLANLEGLVVPYIKALADIQKVLDRLFDNIPGQLQIKSISCNSPLSATLEGGAQAVVVARDMVVPWRVEYAKEIAQLEIQEKLAHIESVKAEVLVRRASAQKDRVETKRIETEVNNKNRLAKIELTRMELENEKLKLEIEEARINLALKVLEKLTPELSEAKRMLYAMQLLKPLIVISDSPLLLSYTEQEDRI